MIQNINLSRLLDIRYKGCNGIRAFAVQHLYCKALAPTLAHAIEVMSDPSHRLCADIQSLTSALYVVAPLLHLLRRTY